MDSAWITQLPGCAMSSQNFDDVEVILAESRPKKREGRKVFKETWHPIFRGVRRRNNDKWVCEVREPGMQLSVLLGKYPTTEMAGRDHDVAALAFRGNKACLNFVDLAWRLPVPISRHAKDVRAAAMEAAEACRLPNGRFLGDVEVVEKVVFVDEEAVFDMPRIFADLAEGLLFQ